MENRLFRIEPGWQSGFHLVRASGELDMIARESLLAELKSRVGGAPLVIDVSEAAFIDASIVGAIFEAAGWARDAGSRLVVVDAQSPPRSLWHITRFADVCPTLRSLEEADAALRE
jgi:anti-anti-sigma factor